MAGSPPAQPVCPSRSLSIPFFPSSAGSADAGLLALRRERKTPAGLAAVVNTLGLTG